MKLGLIELFSQNPKRLSQFYIQNLGFTFVADQGKGFLWLQSGAIEILIRPGGPPPNADKYDGNRLGFVLYIPDVQTALEQLEHSGVEIKGTVDSEKCFVFTDPDGNWFQLVDPDDH